MALWITWVLVRAGRTAWTNRRLVRLLWRGITAAVVGRALALVVAVMLTAAVLLTLPGMDVGIGSLLDFDANAVFTPLEQAVQLAGPAPVVGPDWVLAGLATVFLGALALVIPWLAFIEEEVFRGGLEQADGLGQLRSALRFGLVHLVMLVPVGATLAISVAGLAYGRRYRHAHSTLAVPVVPPIALQAYRPTKRAVAALREADHLEEAVTRQAAGVLASAQLHATFNLMVIGLIWFAITFDALTR